MRIVFWISLLALLAFPVAQAEPVPAESPKAVLVTGASTGIGRKITERLAADGYFVYAGARKDSDLAELNAIENVQALRLDVTKPEEIAAAVEAVTAAGRGLHGLVNNAGVAITGPFSDTSEEDFDFVMQVNVYGPYRVTKAFTPLIVAGKGRITTISSISGILSARDLGVYSMSKHAVEAFADSLALQMEPQGVKVSLVEPGNYNSEIGNTAAMRSGVSRLTDRSVYKSPDEVAAAVKLALFEPEPKRRYLVVPNAYEGEITIRKAVQELVELNEGHAYTYERDALVRMLDEALAKARPAVPAAPL
ncbi:MAG: SDR family NAD(P)-dependent oxidoreductase [Pseudomonadota bacterium]|nr:SDR family NAD(P)-dependent oxidoreductase [Pseudomonadota bacterium]